MTLSCPESRFLLRRPNSSACLGCFVARDVETHSVRCVQSLRARVRDSEARYFSRKAEPSQLLLCPLAEASQAAVLTRPPTCPPNCFVGSFAVVLPAHQSHPSPWACQPHGTRRGVTAASCTGPPGGLPPHPPTGGLGVLGRRAAPTCGHGPAAFSLEATCLDTLRLVLNLPCSNRWVGPAS